MKKSLLTLTTAAIMAVSMSITSWAMTAEEVTAKNPTSYTAGTQSIYGPSLNQDQLNAVAQATADFMTANITEGMDTDQKIKAAYDYIKTRTTYVDWNAATGANTAYTLVTGQGACSGMCRSMKALCDAMGIECYHVHSTSNDHQWNLVRYGDGILYHVDIDANKSAGQDIIYKSLTHPLPYDTSAYPAVGQAQGQGQTHPTTSQPTDGQHTMRASDPEEFSRINCSFGLNPWTQYQREKRNDVNCIVLDHSVGEFSFESSKNDLDPTNHQIWVVGYQFYNGIPVALGKNGEPIVYDFEYDKTFSLDFTGTGKTPTELANYCIQNNIILQVSVVDVPAFGVKSPNALSFDLCYATESSVPTGEISQ